MIATITGTSSYGVAARLKAIVNELHRQDVSNLYIEKIDASEVASADEIINAVRSISLFDPSKIVIIKNLSQSKDSIERVEMIVGQTAEQNHVIIVDKLLDKRTRAYKFLKSETTLYECNELRERELVQWLIGEARSRGCELTPDSAQYLVARAGTNQQLLSSELRKLTLVSDKITKDTIDIHVEANPQSKIFDMLDALFQKKGARAWKLYLEQRQQGEEPQKIMAMIVWQLQQLVLASYVPDGSQATLQRAGVSPYATSKLERLAATTPRSTVKSLVAELAELDYQAKKSADIESTLSVFFARVVS